MIRKIILFFTIFTLILIGSAYLIFARDEKSLLAGVKCQWSSVNCPFYAVHLNNGQVYFGHLARVSSDTITISDTRYLETFEAGESAVSESKNFALQQAPKQIYSLVRRGDEKSLATDHMLHINRSAVLFWEKLSSDSEIVASINAVAGAKDSK